MLRPILGLMLVFLSGPGSLLLHAQEEPAVAQLRGIHLDPSQIYSVREITLNRDALSIYLNRGVIAFTEPVNGKVTGAVFIGSGDILAIPPDPIEKQQLFRFTKSALLNEHFETAIFRFTDGTDQDVLRQYREHAIEDVDPGSRDEVLRWESEIQRRAEYLGDRILADLIGRTDHPFFLAQIEGIQLGWFDAIYDQRRVEEVFVQQNSAVAPILWTSFQRRSEVSDREAVAHEDKTLFDLVSGSEENQQLRVKLKVDGERVLVFPVPVVPLSGISLEGQPLPFLLRQDRLAVVLPAPSRIGDEFVFHFEYAADQPGPLPRTASVPQNAIAPATYRDQWIIEALARYAPAVRNTEILARARQQLLSQSPEGGTYDSLGPVWVGLRLVQPGTTPEYLATLGNKSMWIVHMLKGIMDSAGSNVFTSFLDDVFKQFGGKSISTYDFLHLAEKHSGRDLEWFFDDWVFGTGIPRYDLKYEISPVSEGFRVSGTITQSEVPDTFEMPVPLYADQMFLGNVPVTSAGGEFQFTVTEKPLQVRVDPMGAILMRLN